MSTRIAVLFLAAIFVRAQDATGSVSGIAQDQAGAPVRNHLVTLEPAGGRVTVGIARYLSSLETRTDDYGVYRFSKLAAGAYTLRFESPGLPNPSVKFNLGEGEQKSVPPVPLALAMIRCRSPWDPAYIRFLAPDSPNGSLTGTVRETSREDSPPIAGVDVRLVCTSGDACGRTIATDSKGFFAFENLGPGRYGIAINSPGRSDGYEIKAGIEKSFSFGLHLTPGEEKGGQTTIVDGHVEYFVCE